MQASVNQLSGARRQVFVQAFGEADSLLGANERIGSGSEVGAFTGGGEGAIAGGVNGRISYGHGLSAIGGIAGGAEDYDHVKTDALFMAATALRYVVDTHALVRPYAEVGAWGVPGGDFAFTRTYMNGDGTATGRFTSSGSKYYAYGRLGLTVSPANGDEGVLSGEAGYGALYTEGFAETFSKTDPFQALGPAATDRMAIVKVRAQWSHSFSPRVDATAWAAGAGAFHYQQDLVAYIPGFGPVAPNAPSHPAWVEFGARVGFKPKSSVRVDLFVGGVSGFHDTGVGTEARIGAQASFLF